MIRQTFPVKEIRKRILLFFLTAAVLVWCSACGFEPAAPSDAGSTDASSGEGGSVSGTEEIPTETEESSPATEEPANVFFEMESIGGETVRSSDFPDAKLFMVNFFEPWCGPCVREMPELEKLFEDCRERGLVILGVFYTEGMDGSVIEIIDSAGVTYPILRGGPEFAGYQSQYVPTTVFLNADGQVVGNQEIGARDYDAWLSIVEGLLP